MSHVSLRVERIPAPEVALRPAVSHPASHLAHRALLGAVIGIDLAAAASGIAACLPLRFDFAEVVSSLSSSPGIALLFLGALTWMALLTARGAYRPAVLVSRREQVVRVGSAALVAWVAVHLLAVWLKVLVPFESRLVMALSLPTTLALVVGARLVLCRPLASTVHQRLARGPVLFLGDSPTVQRMAAEFETRDARDRRIAVHGLDDFTPGRAASVVVEQECGEVVIVPRPGQVSEALDVAFACLDAGADVSIKSLDLELIAEGVVAESYERIPHLRLRRVDYSGPKLFFKRLADVVGSAAGLVLLSPFLLAIAAAVRMSSPGPIIYEQERIGYRGRRFRMFKFRTMREGNDSTDYEEYQRVFIREGAAASVAADGTKIYKPPCDPRVTSVGAWLRRLSLDELPQLWNVLKGDMSLVGPRPCLPYEWDLYDDWQRRRFDVAPGCTGLWQVRGRSRVCFDEMVILDLYYAHHGTLFTDAKLVLQTLPVMLLGRGAY